MEIEIYVKLITAVTLPLRFEPLTFVSVICVMRTRSVIKFASVDIWYVNLEVA